MSILWENDKFYIDKGFSVNHVKKATPIREHTHDFVELTYVISGRCTHVVDGDEYPSAKGDLIFINYGSVHSITSVVDCEYADILLKPAFIDDSLAGFENAFSLLALNDFTEFDRAINRENTMIHFSREERELIEVIINLTRKEEYGNDPGKLLIIKSCMNILLTNVFRKMSLPMNSFFEINEELLKFIRENCKMCIKMGQIAAMCGYNTSYFSRLFKKYTGTTFTCYLNNARLVCAEKLLIETDMPIEDIIAESGYSDRSRFFKSFYEKNGVTPKVFRGKVKNQY